MMPLALFLVDQRMPRMSGVEFLEQALKDFPNVKRALLTAYADTDAAISAINSVQIDYYLMKPWDPPEERLYPVLDDSARRLADELSPAVRRYPRDRSQMVASSARGEGVPRAQSSSVSMARRGSSTPKRANSPSRLATGRACRS